mmetsp:Transcript_6073/g.12420  ORF Transcript_6073/g.12420 Transcript_6073/m.12420 type:complete len:419 (+) Transcript_6073:53-1309(+)
MKHSSKKGPGLACQNGLCGNAAESKHCEAAILQLLQLHATGLSLILRQEVLTQEEVACFTVNVALKAFQAQPPTIDFVHGDRRQEGAHDAGLHHLVMRTDGRRVLEDLAWEAGPEVSGNPAERRQHADAPVLKLRLAHEVHGKRLCDVQRVEALLPAHPAVQDLWVLEVGHRCGHPGLLGTERSAHADGDVLDEDVDCWAPPAVRLQERNRNLLKHAVLDHEPHDRHHRQPAVVPLHGLAALELLLRDAIQELGAEPKVGGAHPISPRLDQHFMGANEGDELHPALERERGQCAQTILEALASREAEHLRHDVAEAGNHGSPPMLDLDGCVPFHLCISGTQVQGIPLLRERDADARNLALHMRSSLLNPAGHVHGTNRQACSSHAHQCKRFQILSPCRLVSRQPILSLRALTRPLDHA